jgi:putative CocE/NonD family hydrolase
MEHCGPRDNRTLEARDDVLTFTSPPLESEAFSIGRVRAELHLSSDVNHFDLYLRLCDVAPSGESINMSEELQRLTPRDIRRAHDGVFVACIELRPAAYRFAKGHRIRLQVSGGAHPMFARNTCSGEPVADATTTVVAHNAVHHDIRHPSQVSLAGLSSPLW